MTGCGRNTCCRSTVPTKCARELLIALALGHDSSTSVQPASGRGGGGSLAVGGLNAGMGRLFPGTVRRCARRTARTPGGKPRELCSPEASAGRNGRAGVASRCPCPNTRPPSHRRRLYPARVRQGHRRSHIRREIRRASGAQCFPLRRTVASVLPGDRSAVASV
jgi:hypothetical protein